MKIALISDVHGNLPALDAVLAHAEEMKASCIWNLGDFTGYGAFPDEVVNILKKKKAVSLVGNYDQKVLKVPKKLEDWKTDKTPEKWLAFQWAYDHLSEKSREYLATLPETHKESVKEWKVLFTHGSPEAIDEPLTDETPQERLKDLAKKAHANIILCGHSHKSFMRFAGGSIFINPGSVGRPFDGDPRASYAVISIKKKKIEVDFYRIEYDVERAAKAQEEAGLPLEFAEMTRRGVSLDSLKKDGTSTENEAPQNDKPEIKKDELDTGVEQETDKDIEKVLIDAPRKTRSTSKKAKSESKKTELQ